MPVSPAIAPPESMGGVLAPIAELSDVEFEALERATGRPKSFSLSSKQIKELGPKLPAVERTSRLHRERIEFNLPFLIGMQLLSSAKP